MTAHFWKWLKKDDLIPFWIVAFFLAGSFQPIVMAVVCGLIALDVCYWACRWLGKGIWKVGCWLFNRWRRARVAKPDTTPKPVPPTRYERMQRMAQEAQADFEVEALLLQKLPLDEDERDVLTMQAKQRLLETISQLPEA